MVCAGIFHGGMYQFKAHILSFQFVVNLRMLNDHFIMRRLAIGHFCEDISIALYEENTFIINMLVFDEHLILFIPDVPEILFCK